MQSERMSYIGGTDISSIMGVNPWKTAYRLYQEKVGAVEPDDLSSNEAVQMGIELEDTVARLFEKRSGLKVRKSPKRYYHPDHKFISCQVDRLVTGSDELLECKTASMRSEDDWADNKIPFHYMLQVQWQLMVTGRNKGYIAVLIGGQKFVWREVKEDKETQDKMLEAAVGFWDMVQKRTPPAVTSEDNPLMVSIYPKANDMVITEASQTIEDAISMLQQTKAQIIELEKTKAEIEAKLKEIIGNNNGITTPTFTVKWINIKGSTFTVTKPDGRQLRVTRNK